MAEPIPVREIVAGTRLLHVVTFVDRRSATNGQEEFLLQSQVQSILFGNEPMGTTGAFYRLLRRANVGSLALSLRRSSIEAGLITQEEWGTLIALVYDMLHTGVRAFTLVPIRAVERAIACFGATTESEALLEALDLPRPDAWASGSSDGQDVAMDEEGEEGGEEGEEEEAEEAIEEEGEEEGASEGAGEGEGEDDSDGDGGGGSDGEGGSSSDGSNGQAEGSGGSHASRSRSHHGNTTDEEPEPLDLDAVSHRRLAPILITPQLDSQLAAFDRFRRSTINPARSGKAAAATTTKEDRRSILHFLAWVHHRKGVPSPTFALFHSPKVGAITQEFVEEKSLSCSYARISKVVGSLVAAARFTHAAFEANAKWKGGVSSAAVDQLVALHTQCCSESRLESNFNLARPPKAWLTWEECQRARARAEGAVDAYKGEDADEKLALLQTACLLRLLTGLPPDRVGVYRQLQLGSTLKQAVDGSYQIDLSRRGAHKTSATFGPTRTTVTPSVASRIDALVQADGLQTGEYLFHLASDRSAPLAPAAWTRYVQATFRTYSATATSPGVALSPKACRSSFVTWLRSGDHGDETLKAAAQAMHHSSKMAESAAYDKHGSDRIVAAAMRAANEFALQF